MIGFSKVLPLESQIHLVAFGKIGTRTKADLSDVGYGHQFEHSEHAWGSSIDKSCLLNHERVVTPQGMYF